MFVTACGYVCSLLQSCCALLGPACLCVLPSAATFSTTGKILAQFPRSAFSGIEDFSECVKACCDDHTCNAVFFSQKKCLTIQCKTDAGCAPGPESSMLADAILINLRTVGTF